MVGSRTLINGKGVGLNVGLLVVWLSAAGGVKLSLFHGELSVIASIGNSKTSLGTGMVQSEKFNWERNRLKFASDNRPLP